MDKPKVVVTTKHRGVFFGTLIERNGTEVTLEHARVCVHWSKETRGFIGLASTGPLKGSRVSPSAPRMEVVDVTSIVECTEEAANRWEEGLWG